MPEKTDMLIKEVLKERYLSLRISHFQLLEDLQESKCRVIVTLCHAQDGSTLGELRGQGVGLIDALFRGLMEHYAQEFESLNSIQITGFRLSSSMERGPSQGSDGEALAELYVENSDGRSFLFETKGRSTAAAALQLVVRVVEHFVNSERAFISVYHALRDARSRARPDLVQLYTRQLSELVNTTSYTSVIEKIKNEEL